MLISSLTFFYQAIETLSLAFQCLVLHCSMKKSASEILPDYHELIPHRSLRQEELPGSCLICLGFFFNLFLWNSFSCHSCSFTCTWRFDLNILSLENSRKQWLKIAVNISLSSRVLIDKNLYCPPLFFPFPFLTICFVSFSSKSSFTLSDFTLELTSD